MVPGGPGIRGLAPPPPQQHAGRVQARPIIASVGATAARTEPPPKTRKEPLLDLSPFKNLLIGPELTWPLLKPIAFKAVLAIFADGRTMGWVAKRVGRVILGDADATKLAER
jgi:hypothetical protein